MFLLDRAQIKSDLGPDFPKPAFVLSLDELKALWEFIQWQHLPYNKDDLHKLVKQIGNIVDNREIRFNGMPIHVCDKADPDKPALINPAIFKQCPFCGEPLHG